MAIGDPFSGSTFLGTGGSGGGGFAGFGGLGLATAAAGAVFGAIGGFFDALSSKNQLKSRALSADFDASTSLLNARQAEEEAQFILRAGRQTKALSTLRFGQIRAAQRAAQGASGLQIGIGSAAEAAASTAFAKHVDAITIDVNTTRAAGAARMRSVDFRNRALLARVTAANLRRSAGSISPGMAAFTSLLGSGSSLAGASGNFG